MASNFHTFSTPKIYYIHTYVYMQVYIHTYVHIYMYITLSFSLIQLKLTHIFRNLSHLEFIFVCILAGNLLNAFQMSEHNHISKVLYFSFLENFLWYSYILLDEFQNTFTKLYLKLLLGLLNEDCMKAIG